MHHPDRVNFDGSEARPAGRDPRWNGLAILALERGAPARARPTYGERSRRRPALARTGHQPSGSATARASSARDLIPSLRYTCRRWYSTVFGLKNSAAAVSRVVLP